MATNLNLPPPPAAEASSLGPSCEATTIASSEPSAGPGPQGTGESSSVAPLFSLLESLSSLRADCEHMHQQLNTQIRRQQGELEALLQCQLKVQQYHASMTQAIADFIRCHLLASSKEKVAEGAVAHSSAWNASAANCVGRADLTNESIKFYSIALNRQRDRPASEADDAAARKPMGARSTPVPPSKALVKRGKNDPTLRTLLMGSKQKTLPPASVLPVLQSLLGCSTWKKTLQFVNSARALPENTEVQTQTQQLGAQQPARKSTVVASSVSGRVVAAACSPSSSITRPCMPTAAESQSAFAERLVHAIFPPHLITRQDSRSDTSSTAPKSPPYSPPPTLPSALTGAVADNIRACISQETLRKPRLLGREDHLFFDVFAPTSSPEYQAVIRAEIIIAPTHDNTTNCYFSSCSRPLKELRYSSYVQEVEIVVAWAEAECEKLGRPDGKDLQLSCELQGAGVGGGPEEDLDDDTGWTGSIEDLELETTQDKACDRRASMRFIQLASTTNTPMQQSDPQLLAFLERIGKSSWMGRRWSSLYFANGMWKAELLLDDESGGRKSCFQRSLKEVSYQRAQQQVLRWLLKRAQEHGIRTFRLKPRGEEYTFVVPTDLCEQADDHTECESEEEVVLRGQDLTDRKRHRRAATSESMKKRRQ